MGSISNLSKAQQKAELRHYIQEAVNDYANTDTCTSLVSIHCVLMSSYLGFKILCIFISPNPYLRQVPLITTATINSVRED